jgi:hypothetical protein
MPTRVRAHERKGTRGVREYRRRTVVLYGPDDVEIKRFHTFDEAETYADTHDIDPWTITSFRRPFVRKR